MIGDGRFDDVFGAGASLAAVMRYVFHQSDIAHRSPELFLVYQSMLSHLSSNAYTGIKAISGIMAQACPGLGSFGLS